MREYAFVEALSAGLVVAAGLVFGLSVWQVVVLGVLSFVHPTVVVWLSDHVRFHFSF